MSEVTVEDLAHKILNGTYIPTKDERFQVLEKLNEEVSHLYRTYVRRKGVGRPEVESAERSEPNRRSSDRHYQLMWIIENIFVPGCCAEYLDLVRGLLSRRDQLRTYAARRSGKPEYRYQNMDQWEDWSIGVPLARACGPERESARGYFKYGLGYDQALYGIANQWMMVNGQIDRLHATAVKKCVDRAFFDVHGEKPPPVPRGWWHRDRDLGVTPEEVPEIGLAWTPGYNSDSQSSEPTIPHHIRFNWMRALSCWKDDADRGT